jgi:alpha-D-ribose 1-methylphosphonate 5-phosphate C-P lyase
MINPVNTVTSLIRRSASVSGKKRVFSLIQAGLNELMPTRNKQPISKRQIAASRLPRLGRSLTALTEKAEIIQKRARINQQSLTNCMVMLMAGYFQRRGPDCRAH